MKPCLTFTILTACALPAGPLWAQQASPPPGVEPLAEQAEGFVEPESVSGNVGALELSFTGLGGPLGEHVSWTAGMQSRQPRLDFGELDESAILPIEDRGWAEVGLEATLSISGVHAITRTLELRWRMTGYGDEDGAAAMADTALVWWFSQDVGLALGMGVRTPDSDRFTTWDTGQAWTREERLIQHMEAQMRGDNPYAADAGEAIGELLDWGIGLVTRSEGDE